MTFTSIAKNEILDTNIENDCCQLAFLYAIIRTCGELSISNREKRIEVLVDDLKIYDKIGKIIKNLYGLECEFQTLSDIYLNKKTYYKIFMPKELTDDILKDTGYSNNNENWSSLLYSEIPNNITQSECCLKTFLKGVFVCSATSNIKLSEKASEKTSSGYHLEFTSHNYSFLTEIANILSSFDLTPKIINRKNTYVLYLKEANQICDLLAIIDATSANLVLQNEIVAREMRNQVNRETNCFSANVAKTMSASAKQLEAIEVIRETIGIDSLESELAEVALLRMANQEESLDELLKLSTIKLTKSGLYHRLKKLIKIADSLK